MAPDVAPPPAGGSLTDVTVPDEFTALTLTPLGAGTFPFLGSDQKYHVAYDLQLTNASKVPATLDKIEVVDGREPSKVIASFSGRQLVDPGCPPPATATGCACSRRPTRRTCTSS